MPTPLASNLSPPANLAGVINGIAARISAPQSSDPAGSTDPLYTQMVAHVNDAALEIGGLCQWPQMMMEGSIPIYADSVDQKEKSFDLPPDFLQFIDQTQWNSSTQLPALGPVSPQSWTMYLVRNWVPQLTFFWQLRGGKLWVLNPPYMTDTAQAPKFIFMYRSNGLWIDADDQTLKLAATKNGDTFVLDGLALTLLGRTKVLSAKGFDAGAAERDYQRRIEMVLDQSVAAPVLSLVRNASIPYLDVSNLPDTGYGRGAM